MHRALRSPFLAALVAGGLVSAAVIGLRAAGALEGLELAAYDWHIRLRPAQAEVRAPVVLVAITESDIQQLGTWPLSDAVLAEVLETVSRAGARAIGLDIYRDVPVPPGHERLNAVLAAHKQIIAGMLLPQRDRPGVAPPAVLKDTERVGFTDVIVDPGGAVRRGLLLMDDGRRVFYSLPLRLALLYFQAERVPVQGDPDHPAHMRIGRTTIRPFERNDGSYVRADAGGYQVLLDYRDAPDAFPSVTLGELLAGRVEQAMFKNKIVLVGVTAHSVKDSFLTPYHETTYGVALAGHVASQLVRIGVEGHAPLRVVSDSSEWLWILLWGLFGGAAGFMLRSAWRFFVVLSAGVALLALMVHGSFVLGWWLPLVPPALAWIGAAGAVTAHTLHEEKKARADLMSLFSSYVSAELAEAIWRERDRFLEGGRPRPQRLTATVFFSDVAGFTTVSETLEPQKLLDWFYEFMEATTPLVGDHGGVIFRFLGDSIMAVFGVPVSRTEEKDVARDAVNAVNCALAMQERLIALNRSLQSRGLPLIGMRIGILTGPMVAGSIGSAKRREYNVHGDTVNTAARLESFDRDRFTPDYLSTPCRILIGESTQRYLGDAFHVEFEGDFPLKGKHNSLRIFRVYGRKIEDRQLAA